ncbi:prenyltransferase [Bacteroidales bacterium OttesenSCG-928-A17]|nr:prenyltransferase [Bacteroidales bacterium OttesenSCG-928-A17]
MNIIRTWINNARPIALPQSLLPAILAVCLAVKMPGFNIWLGILAVFGVMAGHLGMNLFDDYFDYKVKESGYRDTLNRKGFRARISKCDYLTSGQATLKQLLIACCVFGAIALGIGIIIWFFLHHGQEDKGTFILWLALITAVVGVSYSGPPLRLSYHGLGELVIGFIFGPLLMTGVFYAACGQWDPSQLFISIPVGLLVTNIVYSHAIMDSEPDREVGKMTFARLLKSKRNMLFFHQFQIDLAYILIIVGVATGYLSPYYLLVFITLPSAIYQQYLMVQFVKDPDRSFAPKWWMGPMGNWKAYKAAGLDWFMIRWLSARNLLMLFCLVIIVVSFIS